MPLIFKSYLNSIKKNLKHLVLCFLVIISYISCSTSENNNQKNSLIQIDSNKENTSRQRNQIRESELDKSVNLDGVAIGNQVWSKNNLDVTHFRNGDPILEAKSNEEWEAAEANKSPAWCYYKNNPENGKRHGRLYNWYAINDSRELAPEGWHIPNQYEWITMTEYLEKDEVGKVLKSITEWFGDGNGNNLSGFTAFPSGNRYSDGTFNELNHGASWWISTKNVSPSPKPFFWGYQLVYNSNRLGAYSYRLNFGMSVRCVNDSQVLTNSNQSNITDQNNESNETFNLNEVLIGNQTWAIENLNVAHFRNGDIIQHVKSLEEWKNAAERKVPSWCYYDNDPENGKKYGRLYNWYAVNDPRGLAPEGWHVPSYEEWETLSKYLQGNERDGNVSGYKMKSTTGWTMQNTEGDNSSGFTGLPGGYRSFKYGKFTDIGTNAVWWTTTEEPNFGAKAESLCWCNGGLNSDWDFLNKENGLSVRCIKD